MTTDLRLPSNNPGICIDRPSDDFLRLRVVVTSSAVTSPNSERQADGSVAFMAATRSKNGPQLLASSSQPSHKVSSLSSKGSVKCQSVTDPGGSKIWAHRAAATKQTERT